MLIDVVWFGKLLTAFLINGPWKASALAETYLYVKANIILLCCLYQEIIYGLDELALKAKEEHFCCVFLFRKKDYHFYNLLSVTIF